MARTWPHLGRPLHVPSRVVAEAALLAVVIGLTLAFSWSDGTPNPGVVDPIARPARFVSEPSMNFGWFGAAVGGHIDVTYRVPIPTSPPATILISSINVHRPVEEVGTDRSGALSVPQNLWNAGWYRYGPVPGAPGDAVIEGHAGWPNAPLLFGRLNQLRKGDQIVVVLADGSRRLFLVDSLAVWPARSYPTGLFATGGPPRLTLITCTGPFDAQFKTYADRLVVEATYAGQS
ncbi:MAG TPA: class F sortase [Streptosporangiaceae bacterium]|nr:class F sortase [Streptosporangiaceae bacterium]